ncbi:hypothetical protein ACFQ0M_45845 [Kitasatospora aburaviensis]
MLDAIAKAKGSGKPVVVDRLTSEASRTLANPNGTLTTTDNAQPVRTKRDGGWADIDSTLRGNTDGTLSPSVATTGLVFSGVAAVRWRPSAPPTARSCRSTRPSRCRSRP